MNQRTKTNNKEHMYWFKNFFLFVRSVLFAANTIILSIFITLRVRTWYLDRLFRIFF